MSAGRGRAWIDHHWRSLLFGVAGVLLGGVVGWWAGSATACVHCEANAAGIEALGTWVGGVGTVAAVGFAVIAFRSEEQSRRDLERQLLTTRREQLEHDRKEAEQVTISFMVGSTVAGDQATELRAQVTNGTSTSEVYKLSGEHDDFETIGFEHTLGPGKTYTQSYMFGHMNARRPTPVKLPPNDDRPEWLNQHKNKIQIRFELRDREWTRRGDSPITEVI